LALSVLTVSVLPSRLVVFDGSPSLPSGFYMLTGEPIAAGSIIEFRVADSARNRCLSAGMTIPDGTILKPVAAVNGDVIDTTGDWLVINGKAIAPLYNRHPGGKPVSVWRGKRRLQKGEYFVVSHRVWNSLDSRVLGPIRHEDVVAVRRPLWTW